MLIIVQDKTRQDRKLFSREVTWQQEGHPPYRPVTCPDIPESPEVFFLSL